MKKPAIFLATLICFVFIASVNAQIKEATSKDVRLVKDQPHVYINFEREGRRKPFKTEDSNRGVWLRFHNNSKWQVGVCMWDVPKEYGDKEINYEVERYGNSRFSSEKTPATSDPEGSCLLGLMKPGDSLVFSVPREHLAGGLTIKVPFRYEWEIDPDGFLNGLEPKHYAYFYSSDIPKK